MMNLKNCGEDIDRVDGELVPNNTLFAFPELWNTARFAALYSSYIGLILYRLNGFGRMPYDLYFNSAVKPQNQLVFFGVLAGASFLVTLPVDITDIFDLYTVQVIVCNFLPLFFLGVFSTYILPMTTTKMLNYPLRIPDEVYDEMEGDDKYLSEQPTLLEDSKNKANGK